MITHWSNPETWYIAVHENGFGCDRDAVRAIRIAQESVALDAKPKQLAIYRAYEAVEPTGVFDGKGKNRRLRTDKQITWPNGAKVHLCGLTNTHAGWQRRTK